MREMKKLLPLLGVFCLLSQESNAFGFVFPTQATHLIHKTHPSFSEVKIEQNLFDLYAKAMDELDFSKKPKSPRQAFLKHRTDLLAQLSAYTLHLATPLATVPKSSELQALLTHAQHHPVAGEGLAARPEEASNRPMGYCFGRAAYLHLELLRRQVPGIQIAKLFALGNFLVRERNWDFHVATLTLTSAENLQWLVLDPSLFDRPVFPSQWIERVQSLSSPGERYRVRFYFSDPVKFHPLYGAYDQKDLFSSDFGNYFRDLAEWFDRNPLKLAHDTQLIWSLPSIKN